MNNVKDRNFQVRVAGDFLRRLDDARRMDPDLPSRAEMARRLLEEGLDKKLGKRTTSRLKVVGK